MDLLFFTHNHSFYLVLFLVGSSICFEGDFGQMLSCCTYKDYETKELEFEMMYLYNKKLLLEYNNIRGNWTGFTAKAMQWAQERNNDPHEMAERKFDKFWMCSELLQTMIERYNLRVAPILKLKSVKQSSGTQPALLSCSAYNFYPKEIQMTWLVNGQEIKSAVSSTEILSDGDLFYQIHSNLEYSPKPGEIISCMVEHETLPEPLVQVWDSSHQRSERDIIAVGTLFLVLGLMVMFTGFIFYKKFGHCTLFQGHRMTRVEVVHEDRTTNETL